MAFLQFTLHIGARDPAPYEAALFDLGALSITLLDAADDPVLEPAPGETPLWPTVVARALFDQQVDAARIESALRVTPGLDSSVADAALFEPVIDRVWEREWLKDFRPMRFGRRLWVCPGGQSADTADSVCVQLDPGLAFGTGTHATTALCLQWLDSGAAGETRWLAGASVIDYGCGSGILTVAALLLGASRAIAMDIDPQALLATEQNAARNGVLDRVQVTSGPGLDGAVADVLLANILAGPLIELAPRLAHHVRRGGRIALSGLLLDQVDTVTAAYLPWFDVASTGARDGWGLLTGCRREDSLD